ncbi:MAG: ZIP family metal transporter [Patescibacteria group bacterium]|nr:ZIP family metal transporter [Patescibacteria group bacterium]
MLLFFIILATTLIGLISVVGILFFLRDKNKDTFTRPLISLAAGTMLAVTFTDLLPESTGSTQFEPKLIFLITLASIIFFFLFERVIHWHHCRCDFDPSHESKKHLAYINLLGDGIHNIVDGFLVAGAFLLSVPTGIAVTLAVILHEIPQEISDFAILLYAGLTKAKALTFNFLISLTAVAGAIAFYYFGNAFNYLIPLVTAFAAGNFIYLAAADLIPELHHENNPKKIISNSIWLLLGVFLIIILGRILPHG